MILDLHLGRPLVFAPDKRDFGPGLGQRGVDRAERKHRTLVGRVARPARNSDHFAVRFDAVSMERVVERDRQVDELRARALMEHRAVCGGGIVSVPDERDFLAPLASAVGGHLL